MSGPPPPNGPPDYDPNRQPYPPPPWNGQPQSPEDHQQPPYQYPPPGSYPPPPDQDRAYYPPPHYPPANMAAIHPHQGQDAYRLPPPPPGAYRPDAYGQPPPATQVVHYQAAAPRQRTAIACRYCRRRKIRCSGFETSADGRCTNCIRFNQECMFTPVSSQAQAFVPAQVAYPHLRNQQAGGRSNAGMTLYGAHGQPLPPQQQPETTLPPPQGMYGPYGRPPMDGAPQPLASSMPDPRQPGRRSSGSGFDYPDPTNLAPVTPAATPGYQPHTAPSPYYPPPPHDRRTSPQSAYGYDARHSSSPHSSPYPPMAQAGPTPPPTSTPGGSARSGGLNVRDMLNPGNSDPSHGRSSTDSDMLNALNRRGPQ